MSCVQVRTPTTKPLRHTSRNGVQGRGQRRSKGTETVLGPLPPHQSLNQDLRLGPSWVLALLNTLEIAVEGKRLALELFVPV